MTDTINKNKRKGRVRAVVAGGVLLGMAAMTTAAIFNDNAFMNLGGASGQFAVAQAFNMRVVKTDAANVPLFSTFAAADAANGWQEADNPAGVAFAIVGSTQMVPGNSPLSVRIPFKNDNNSLDAKFTLSMASTPGVTSDAALMSALRFSVSVNGAAVAGYQNVAYTTFTSMPVANPVVAGSGGLITISVSLPDQGSESANRALMGKVAGVQAVLHAESL